jgi:UbiA prenyltransferase family
MGSAAISGVTWPTALRLGRVSNLPTVWTNVLAGAILSGARLAPGRVLALMLRLSAFYVAGMYLNDAFDAAYDRQHRPGRPIPSGAVAESTVFAIGAALIGSGLILLLGLSPGRAGLGDSRPASRLQSLFLFMMLGTRATRSARCSWACAACWSTSRLRRRSRGPCRGTCSGPLRWRSAT